MRKIINLVCIFGLVSNGLYCQELLHLDNGCIYSGESFKTDIYSFDSDAEAEGALKRVMKFTGLPANFVIKAADVPNAQASISGTTRLILYNQLFMMKVKQATNTDWAAISILAHEIGHHLAGHTLDGLGSRPSKELEADRFSGFILAKMGATLEQSLVAIESIASDEGSVTHPPRSARIAAITNGWRSEKDIEGSEGKNIGLPPIVDNPIKQGNIPINTPILVNIQNTWAEYDVFVGSQKGIKIHLSFNVNNMQNIRGRAIAYFCFQDGRVLKDFNGMYCTMDGQVSSGEDFNPSNKNTTYNDLAIFLPNGELHMNPGNYDLKFYVKLFEYSNPNNSQEIGETQYITFNFSK